MYLVDTLELAMQIFFKGAYALQFMHIDKRLSAWNHMEKPHTVCSLSRDPYVKKKICGLCSLCFMWSGNFGQQTLFVAPDTKSHRLLMCVLCPTRTNSWWVFFCQNCTNCWCMVFCPKHKNCWCEFFCPNAECHFWSIIDLVQYANTILYDPYMIFGFENNIFCRLRGIGKH